MSEDYVNHPSHYTCGGKECIDVIKESLTPEQYAGYLMGTQIKYIYRHKNKWNPREDLDKSDWYLDKFISDCTKFKRKKLSKKKRSKCKDICSYSSETRLQKYISALTSGKKSILKCKEYLTSFKSILGDDDSMQSTDNPKSFSSELNNVEKHMNDIFSKYSDFVKPITQNTEDTSDSNDISYGAAKVFDSLKFLSNNYPELWNNAYSFKYDPDNDKVIIYSCFGTDNIPIMISISYNTHRNWSINISTEDI